MSEAPLVTFAKSMGEDGENFALLFTLNRFFNEAVEAGLVAAHRPYQLTDEGDRILRQAIGFHDYMSNRKVEAL